MIKIKMVGLILLFIITGCFGNDEEKIDDVRDPDEISDGENITLTGRVGSYMDGNLFFTLIDGDQHYTIFIDGDEEIIMGEYVRVSGLWNEAIDGLEKETLDVLTETEKIDYFKERFIYITIDINNFPNNINHTCVTPKFDLTFTNHSQESLSHQDLHDDDFPYAVYYFINEQHSVAHGTIDDYQEIYEQTNDAEIGLLSNQGFIRFSDIQFNNSEEVEYWAGGKITRSEFGTAGSPNILGNYNAGEHEISFAWALRNNYDPIFLFISDPVKVNLLSAECELR